MRLKYLVVKVVMKMFEYRPYYRSYPSYMYQGYNRYGPYNPLPTYPTDTAPTYHENTDNEQTTGTIDTDVNREFFANDTMNEEESKDKGFRLGPLTIDSDRIDLFGFSIAIDDLIIVGVILLLFFQSDRDYTLLIILGLMLFNITFSSLNLF